MSTVLFAQSVWHEYLGTMYLSAVLRQHGHKTDVVIGGKKAVYKRTKELCPDLIAFSTMTADHIWVSETAQFLCEKGITTPMVAGGPHPTFFPEFINDPSIDIICRGEGEYALLDLVNAIESDTDITRIRNLIVKQDGKLFENPLRPLVEDLDELPFPDRDLYRKYKFFRDKRLAVFMGMRGCPYRCSFCFEHQWNTLYAPNNAIRYHSVRRIIDEISHAEGEYELDLVMMIDSSINLKKDWILEFLKEYVERVNVKFSVNLRVNLIDEDVVRAIAETQKCAHIRFAIESGSERVRNEVIRKNLTDKEISDAAMLFDKYHLETVIYNMMGLPTEAIEDAYQTIKTNQSIKPTAVTCMLFIPYPGSDITNFCIQQGIVDEKDFIKLGRSTYNFRRSILKQQNISQLTNLQKFSIVAIRYPFLFPVIKQLAKLPPNLIFDMVFNITQSAEWVKWLRMDARRFIQEAVHSIRKII